MTPANSQNRDKRSLKSELEGAIEWWREAGIDGDFVDDPVDRIAEAEEQRAQENPVQPEEKPVVATAKAKPAPAPSAAIAKVVASEHWPQSLEEYAAWWLDEKSVELGGTGPRIAPRGSANPELMVIVSQPEEGDRETLLSGHQGKLLAGFLRAAGLAIEDCYLASALPRAVALPDWNALRAAGLGGLTAHHINLVQPKRLLVFARNVLPLLGHDQAQGAHALGGTQGMNRELPVLAAPGLEELHRSAPRRKRLWHDWLEWTAT